MFNHILYTAAPEFRAGNGSGGALCERKWFWGRNQDVFDVHIGSKSITAIMTNNQQIEGVVTLMIHACDSAHSQCMS